MTEVGDYFSEYADPERAEEILGQYIREDGGSMSDGDIAEAIKRCRNSTQLELRLDMLVTASRALRAGIPVRRGVQEDPESDGAYSQAVRILEDSFQN